MLAVVGTVPDPDFPLIHGRVDMEGDQLSIDGHAVPIHRGTPALLASAVRISRTIGGPELYAFLVGDIGKGDGSRRLYRFLTDNLPGFSFEVLTFHYLQPDVDWHNKVLFAVEAMKQRPVLIADAGFMYAAKMSGQAAMYDYFTPDVGELAFLADESAPHPFYTRGFILHQDNQTPDLIRRAYQNRNAAENLLVKGKTDHIARESGIIETIDYPSCSAMEAIGGTGDTITGLLTVLLGAGFGTAESAILSAKINRWIGWYADPTPATQVSELIDKIPQAWSRVSEEEQLDFQPF